MNKNFNGTWTHFWDMHSGGGQKLKWAHIFIQAEQKVAEIVFYNKFHRNPHRVTCTCCGPDYSINETKFGLKRLTGYHRGCQNLETPEFKNGKNKGLYRNMDKDKYFQKHYYLEKEEKPKKGYHICTKYSRLNRYIPLEKFINQKNIKVIFANQIEEREKTGELPEEGYVWKN